MLRPWYRWIFSALLIVVCDGQLLKYPNIESIQNTPLPFPACRVDNIDCLKRGLRTFFILMDNEYLGMKPIDPTFINSVAISLPDQQMTFLLRRANVTGARWTRLADRKFNLERGKSGVTFSSDLHVTGEISVSTSGRVDPHIAHLTMDIEDVETNITYNWSSQRGIDNEDYIFLGPERIAIRNMRLPTFFLQPNSEDAAKIDQMLQARQSVLDHLANEVTAAVMHTIVDNFRLFGNSVPAVGKIISLLLTYFKKLYWNSYLELVEQTSLPEYQEFIVIKDTPTSRHSKLPTRQNRQ